MISTIKPPSNSMFLIGITGTERVNYEYFKSLKAIRGIGLNWPGRWLNACA